MSDETALTTEVIENWRPKVLTLGVIIGALAGLGAAYLMVQRADKRGVRPELSAKEGVTLGMLVFGLLRQISVLGENEK